ncbi:uncharacterized protein EV422DRAFT_570233 [Fimicolochytrium jonesii]|uniref:uncharacterized protein n=1 Tax=Fimicolochytrium jonesii TaxID=1396493 RepID=UPI0022FDF0E5|nr:uncharacterized protein EV422DRAFT_570233 [Fimicolochytrium jonesii]KAI8817768.1 hypothetical protein EV422DRAFT_570233 [Fimicolochytrium jonesii]
MGAVACTQIEDGSERTVAGSQEQSQYHLPTADCGHRIIFEQGAYRVIDDPRIKHTPNLDVAELYDSLIAVQGTRRDGIQEVFINRQQNSFVRFPRVNTLKFWDVPFLRFFPFEFSDEKVPIGGIGRDETLCI